MPDEKRSLGVALSGLQNIYEFRVGTGRILGIRVEEFVNILATTFAIGIRFVDLDPLTVVSPNVKLH